MIASLRECDGDVQAGCDAVYLIVSVQDPEDPQARGYWIRDGKIDEAELAVV